MTPQRMSELIESIYQLQDNAEQLIEENERLKKRIKELEKRTCST